MSCLSKLSSAACGLAGEVEAAKAKVKARAKAEAKTASKTEASKPKKVTGKEAEREGGAHEVILVRAAFRGDRLVT